MKCRVEYCLNKKCTEEFKKICLARKYREEFLKENTEEILEIDLKDVNNFIEKKYKGGVKYKEIRNMVMQEFSINQSLAARYVQKYNKMKRFKRNSLIMELFNNGTDPKRIANKLKMHYASVNNLIKYQVKLKD